MRSWFSSIRRGLAAPVALVLTAAASPAVASAQLYTPQAIGQTFTAPTTGGSVLELLSFAPYGLFGTSGPDVTYFLQIFALTSDPLAGTPLFSQTLGASFFGLTVSPNLALVAGQQYVAVVPDTRNLSGGGGLGASYPANTISGGSAVVCFYGGGGCSQTTSTGNDLDGFSTQFGSVAVVSTPEPASVVLVGSGLVLAIGGRRRSQRRRSTLQAA